MKLICLFLFLYWAIKLSYRQEEKLIDDMMDSLEELELSWELLRITRENKRLNSKFSYLDSVPLYREDLYNDPTS